MKKFVFLSFVLVSQISFSAEKPNFQNIYDALATGQKHSGYGEEFSKYTGTQVGECEVTLGQEIGEEGPRLELKFNSNQLNSDELGAHWNTKYDILFLGANLYEYRLKHKNSECCYRGWESSYSFIVEELIAENGKPKYSLTGVKVVKTEEWLNSEDGIDSEVYNKATCNLAQKIPIK